MAQFVYVAVKLPSRELFYYREETKTNATVPLWTGDISRAKIFPDKSYTAPLRALKLLLPGELEHKWVELHS